MKLVPTGERYEARLRGPMLMQGYLDEPEKTAAAFDEEGYYRTGDLVVFHDRDDPAQGLAFAGRMAEEFKLSNGTWVYGGQMRDKLLKTLNEELAEIVLADDGVRFSVSSHGRSPVPRSTRSPPSWRNSTRVSEAGPPRSGA